MWYLSLDYHQTLGALTPISKGDSWLPRVERFINIEELLVGDIALLELGDIAPCDGMFISGRNVGRD